jgi:hypothetical protein
MAVSNSNIRLQEIVDDAASLGDVAPALATGGMSDSPALSIANDVMQTMVNGGPGGQPYNWKWNRLNVEGFPTISLQQDYFLPGVSNIGWLENAWASNINQAVVRKDTRHLEVRRDLDIEYVQTGHPGKICWLPNDQIQTGTWGQVPLGPTAANPDGDSGTVAIFTNPDGLQNPGPGVVYTYPINTVQTPTNATTCLTDSLGNLWSLTGFGTCGLVEPTWTPVPLFPTFNNPNIVASTVIDGTCVWTAIDPKGQGMRLSPTPAQSGTVWLIEPVAQRRAPRFASLSQSLDPIPDDYVMHFKQGFFSECYRRNPDPKVRAKYPMERQMWLETLARAIRQGDREQDDFGFYPGSPIMDSSGGGSISPSNPYGPY